MRGQPYVDGSRIIVTGQSMGGWNALAVGALKVPVVNGVVSFAGGVRVKGCSNGDERLISAAGKLGGQSTLPSLRFFGDNDSIFPTSTWRGMHQHYVAAGGNAELVSYGLFRSDSHDLLSSWEGLSVWVPRLDAFLARIGMPSASTYPENMPMPVPPASGYAKIDDVDALPYVNSEKGKAFYRKFLKKPIPRVFVVGDGVAADAYESFDPLTSALRRCEAGGKGKNCRLYAVDNKVVWTRPTPAPPPTDFAALANQNAVPYLDAKGREEYKKFLAAPRPRAFVIAPDGTWSVAVLGPDPIATAIHGCRKAHRKCRLYAVDGEVVW